MINAFVIILGIILLFRVLYYEKKKDRIPLLSIKFVLSLLFVMTGQFMLAFSTGLLK
jgi:hypothetical protein